MHTSQKLRAAWIDKVKTVRGRLAWLFVGFSSSHLKRSAPFAQAMTIEDMATCITEIVKNTRPEWLRPWLIPYVGANFFALQCIFVLCSDACCVWLR